MSILEEIKKQVGENVAVVAISKTKPPERILEVYKEGHHAFGENKVQELTEKYELLPKDIQWHFVGHLQRNKVKYLAPFVHLIHGVDSLRLAREINKQAERAGRKISVLIQAHIAKEESKFGVPVQELEAFMKEMDQEGLECIKVRGLMGMATNTSEQQQVQKEFMELRSVFDKLGSMNWNSDIRMQILSMGMTGDYEIAVNCGSNMVRIGTKIFGAREI